MANIVFDEVNHKYYLDGKELISVTTLMSKHGLAPSYEHVNSAILEKAAAKGTLVHKEIEDYIKTGEVGFTPELHSFIKYCNENDIEFISSEKIVYNDICAGTCDFVCRYRKLNRVRRVDFKTTSTIHKVAVSWQLSLYDDMDEVKADDLEVWHFLEDGSLEVKEMPFVAKEKVDKLFSDERNGTLPTLALNNTQLEALAYVEYCYREAERIKNLADKRLAEIKESIINAFEDNNVKSFETDTLKITYVAPTTRTGIDTTRLKKEHPEIFSEYTKVSNVSASLKITGKGE